MHCYFTFVGLVLFFPNFFCASLGTVNFKLSFPNLVSFSPFFLKNFFFVKFFYFMYIFCFAFIALLFFFLYLLFVNALVYVVGCTRAFGWRKKFHVSHSLNICIYSTMNGNE